MLFYEEKDVLHRQKHMSPALLAWMVILITTLLWMSFDIYLPALPDMRDSLGVSEGALNLTIVFYEVFCALGTLIGGPLSDKYGRIPLLRAGYTLFLVFTVLCAFVNSLPLLILVRGVAALGCGFVLTVITAMIKDSFSGEGFRRIMTLLQSMAVIGPIFSPILGAAIMAVLPWHWIFILTALLGLISAVPAFLMSETLSPENRVNGSVLKAVGNLFTITRNASFTAFLAIVSLIAASYYAYMSVCSYIYIDLFHTTYLTYGIYYGAACLVSFLAPFLYLILSKKAKNRILINACIALNFLSGALLLLFGSVSAVIFFLILTLFLIAEGIIRPLGVVILMNQYEEHIGAVSAISGFGYAMIGILGSIAATLHWSNYISGLGIVLILCAVVPLIIWFLLLRLGGNLKGL